MAQTAVVAGVGPGLGAALVRKLTDEGCSVAMLARSTDFTQQLATELSDRQVLPVAVDIARPDAVASAFERVRSELGPVDILINHASGASWKGLLELDPEEFEFAWRVSVYGAFLCSRQAVPDMLERGSGCILFTGATSAVRGRAGAVDFSSAKFAVRGLADSMAREFWPRGIHVAHVVIDGVISPSPQVRPPFDPVDDEPLLEPHAIASTYWSLVQQERSSWTFELDVRPHGEEFFQ